MKLKILLAGFLLVVSALSSFAAEPYIGVAGGVSFIHDSDIDIPGLPTITADYKTGFGLNVSGGTQFEGGRVEGEFGYKKADVDKFSGPDGSASVSGTDITVMSFMVNGYLENPKRSVCNPYLGVGLGLINGEIDVQNEKGDDTALGYQVMVGAGITLNKETTLDISYRFQGVVDEFNVDDADISYNSSNIFVGLRYYFHGSR